MSKLFFASLLTLAVAASAAAVTGADVADAEVAPEVAVRSYKPHHQPKCVIKYQKCCEEKKYKQCEKQECGHHYWYCPKKHYYRAAVPEDAAAGGEVDASIKTYGHGGGYGHGHGGGKKKGGHGHGHGYKKHNCYWKQDCKTVHYKCEDGYETKCYGHKERYCHGDWCAHW